MLWFRRCVSGTSDLQIRDSPTDLSKLGVGITTGFWSSDSNADDPNLRGNRCAFLEAKGHCISPVP